MKDEAGRRGGIAASDAYAALQTKLEELDAYTHTVLHQFPRIEQHLLFAGYRIWPTHILPRKRNIKRARSSFKKLAKAYAAGKISVSAVQQRVHAFRAYTKHCCAGVTTEAVLGELQNKATGFLL